MKKFLILNAIILSLASQAFSCGWGPTYNLFSLYFHPVESGEKWYPFKFILDTRFYNYKDTDGDMDHSPPNNGANIKAWNKYMGKELPEKDVSEFIYHSNYSTLHHLYYHIEQGQKFSAPDSFRQNKMTGYFLSEKNREALGYLMYAKQCEESLHRMQEEDEWGYKTYKNLPISVAEEKLIKNGGQLYRAAKNDWIKKRYAFQMIRLAHYFRDFDLAAKLYREYAEPLPDTEDITQCWLWGLKGGILYRQNKKDEAAVYFAKSVVHSPDKYIENYNDYTHCKNNFENSLSYCKTTLDSADLIAVESFSHPELSTRLLQRYYAIQPNSELFSLLWSRELSKLELGYFPKKLFQWNTFYYYYDPEKEQEYDPVAEYLPSFQRMKELAGKIIAENKIKEQRPYLNTLIYFDIIENNLTEAQKWISASADKNGSREDILLTHLYEWIIRFKRNETIQEKELLEFLNKADALNYGNQSIESSMYHFLTYFVAPYYREKDPMKYAYILMKAKWLDGNGEWVNGTISSSEGAFKSNSEKAEVALSFELDTEVLEQMLHIQQMKKFEDPFVQWANHAPSGGIHVNDLRDILYHKYVRLEQYEKAKKYIVPDEYDEESYRDPLQFRTMEQMEWSPKDKNGTKYGRRDFLELATGLQGRAKNGDAEDIFRYGMILYNLSYYGNCESASMHWRNHTGYEGDAGNDTLRIRHWYYSYPDEDYLLNHPELQNYFYLTKAQRLFNQAQDRLKSEEARAQCAYMLALCWQKNWRTNEPSLIPDDEGYNYVRASVRNPYFGMLNGKFKNTQVHKDVYTSCSYYRLFVGNR